MQPCLSNYTIHRVVQLKPIVLYCIRNARFPVHTSRPRKFSECAARFLIRPDYFNNIYIEQTDLGVGFHNLMNNLKSLTFRVKTLQLLLLMKSQLNVNSLVPQGFISKRKTVKRIQMSHYNRYHFTIEIFPFHAFLIAHLISTV